MIAPRQAPAEQGTATLTTGQVGTLRRPMAWGLAWGCLQAASPLAFFWLDDTTVYALGQDLE